MLKRFIDTYIDYLIALLMALSLVLFFSTTLTGKDDYRLAKTVGWATYLVITALIDVFWLVPEMRRRFPVKNKP